MIKLFLTAAMKEDNKSVEDTTGGTFTEGEEPYLDDDESYVEPLEGSSSSFQDDYAESIGGKYYSFSISNYPCFKDKLPKPNGCKSIKEIFAGYVGVIKESINHILSLAVLELCVLFLRLTYSGE